MELEFVHKLNVCPIPLTEALTFSLLIQPT